MYNDRQIEQVLMQADRQAGAWAGSLLAERTVLQHSVAERLEYDRERLAALITAEMGKLVAESRAEVDNCAWVCRYYAEHAAAFLAGLVGAGTASDRTGFGLREILSGGLFHRAARVRWGTSSDRH